jgi:hypothetical protein
MDKELLFLPPYLQTLGYANLPGIRELADRAVIVTTEAIQHESAWSAWRGILEYVSCVEYARGLLKGLPIGRAIGSVDVVPARYHSASLVFFAQATLDNLAVWSSTRLNLDARGSDCAFHKSKFNQALAARVPNVAASMQLHAPFVVKLESYRQEWIHRLAGGARVFSDKSPSEPDAEIQIMVPINPSIGQYEHDPNAYLRAVARTRTNNGGRWLYPVAEFADELADALKAFLLAFLVAALAEPLFSTT